MVRMKHEDIYSDYENLRKVIDAEKKRREKVKLVFVQWEK